MDYVKEYIDIITENTKQVFESISKMQEGTAFMFEQILLALSKNSFPKFPEIK